MALNRKHISKPQDLLRQFKQIDVDGTGEAVYAEVHALEPGSIGAGGSGGTLSTAAKGTTAAGSPTSSNVDANTQALDVYVRGGGAGGGAVTVADGADVAEGATTATAWSGSGAGTTISILKAVYAKVAGTLTTDVADRAARLLGHVTVDNASIPVTGTFWQATQPVSGTVTADTELPAAAALSDNVSNPTTSMVGGATMVWDSSLNAGAGGWSRAAGTAAGGLKVNVGNASLAVTGPLTDTQLRASRVPVDASGVAVPVTDNSGSLTVDAPVGTPVFTRLSDGAAALIGQKTMAASLPVTVASDQGALPVSGSITATPPVVTPILKNGLSALFLVIGAAAVLEDYYVYNPNSSVAYVQIFDAATTAAVTLGTTAPKWSVGIPATSAANVSRLGLNFASGIVVAATTSATGSTAPTTALDTNWGYR